MNMSIKQLKLWSQFWKWYKSVEKLSKIRKMTAVYYNDSKFVKITQLIDE